MSLLNQNTPYRYGIKNTALRDVARVPTMSADEYFKRLQNNFVETSVVEKSK